MEDLDSLLSKEQENTTHEELAQLKQEITGSIDQSLSDTTDILKNTFNPYRSEYGPGIYKNPKR